MVLKSVHMKLSTAEVPVTFLKDREGRLSHHKRAGRFSPFQAAWINLRAMFIYGSDFFLFKPGLVLIMLGLLISLPVTVGDVNVGVLTLSLNWQFLGIALLIVGFQAFFLGCLAQVLFDYAGQHSRRWLRVFPYTRTVLVAFTLFVVGIGLAIPLVVTYVTSDFVLQRADTLENHLAVTGLGAVIMGAQLFIFTLLLHGTVVATTTGRPRIRSQE
jgi:hypothetical protein